jgi:hypothetical protein
MSIFKEPIKPAIVESIKARQDALINRTPQTLQYYNSRNAWIRMSSAVEVNGDGGDLAKKYILQGGTTDVNSTKRSGVGDFSKAYSNSSVNGTKYRLGIRPMPGITGIDVKSRSAYGSLREVTVNFNAWDIHQLEDLELLYMRPGYTVLVEWGWAPYLKGNQGLETTVSYINSVVNAQKNSVSKESIWKDLFKKSLDTYGNYDALYGFIKNYSWTARPDGGYDCSVTVISIGEILESLKINYVESDTDVPSKGVFRTELAELGTTVPFSTDLNLAKSYAQNKLAGIINELYLILKSKLSNLTSQSITLSDGVLYDCFRFDLTIENAPEQVAKSDFNNNTQIYITLESLVSLLNRHILLQDQNESPITELSVTEGGHMSNPGALLLCLGNKYQVSTNPFICQIKNTAYNDPAALGFEEGWNGDFTTIVDIIKNLGKQYWYDDSYETTQLGIIGNIYVNLSYVYSLITSAELESQDKKEKNEILLFDFLKNLLNGINSSIGNVANLDVFIDPQDSKARIIDVNYADSNSREEVWKNCFTFEIQNTKSIVRSYSFESQIFPDQSTIIAIGAQAEGGALDENVETLIDFNQKLIDRVVTKRISPTKAKDKANTTSTAEQAEQKEKNLKENYKIINSYFNQIDPDWYEEYFGLFGGAGDFDVEDGSKYSSALRDIINNFTTLLKDDSKNRGIIPTKLSLTIDGIGGLIIGNIFKIPEDVTPRGYKGVGAGPTRLAYVITGLGHSVKDNDWVTNIEAQFIILDEPKGKKTTTSQTREIKKEGTEGSGNVTTKEGKTKRTEKPGKPPGPPSKDLPPNLTVDKVIKAMQNKGYVIYANTPFGRNRLNIVGIKNIDKVFDNKTPVTNYFSDLIVMFYYDEKGVRHERIGRNTVVAGLYYQATWFGNGNPKRNAKGTRTITTKEGQYIDAYFQGTHNGYQTKALIQIKEGSKEIGGFISYTQDNSLNSIYNISGQETGRNGTNIHNSGNYSGNNPKKEINNWSGGCQVFRNIDDFNWMSQAADNQLIKTKYNRFSYTLLNIRDISGFENITEIV